MTVGELQRTIRKRLDAEADADVRKSFERLVPGAKILGVRVPALRSLAAEVKKQNPALSIDAACDLLDRLCRDRVREEVLVGTFLLARFGKSVALVPWKRIEAWLAAVDNWETCDQLAMGVAAPVLAASAAPAAPLVRLARSKHRWTRRFAVATAAALNQQGRRMTAPAFAVCAVVAADEDAMVQKAVAWAIREASKQDERAAFEFLEKARRTMPPRVLREAAEKLSPSLRARLGA